MLASLGFGHHTIVEHIDAMAVKHMASHMVRDKVYK